MRIGRTYVYERSTSHNEAMTCGIVGAISVALTLWMTYCVAKSLNEYRDVRASLGSLIIHPDQQDGHNTVDESRNGAVVHAMIPQHELRLDRVVHDAMFSVDVPGAVTLHRRVEYCQWREHVHERTEKLRNDKERVVRTYTYTKGWVSSPISSFLFDQPAAHFNPQRRPVAPGLVDAAGMSSTSGFSINVQHAQELAGTAKTFTFKPESLRNFVTSPAAVNEHFFFTGNNGWFLSKHDPSTAQRAMKAAFQYAEGTLLDFQLGDLFSVCEAGDVRVALEGKAPLNGVSVVALQSAGGVLVPFKTLQGRDMMLLQEGQLTIKQMTSAHLSAHFWPLLGNTLACAVLGLVSFVSIRRFVKARSSPQIDTANNNNINNSHAKAH